MRWLLERRRRRLEELHNGPLEDVLRWQRRMILSTLFAGELCMSLWAHWVL